MAIVEVSADNFDTLLETHPLILIDFWAEWCKPCLGFSKILETIAPEYPDFLFASVNVEEQKALAEEFAIRSVPFVMIVRERVVVYAESGALTAEGLRELLDQTKALDARKLETNDPR